MHETNSISFTKLATCSTAWTVFVALWHADKYNGWPLNS